MRKQHLFLLYLLLFMITPCLRAQKKELSQARSYIKSGKDYDKAEKLMTDLLANDPANSSNIRIYQTWYAAVMKQYEAANEKLYLRQQYDTAAFFNLTRRLYTIASSLDSLDAMPDEKGRVKPRFREDNAKQLDQLRPNLYFGGTYFVRKADYSTAFNFFDTYISADCHPLFTGYDYQKHDSRMPQAAYWATFSAHKLDDANRTLRYYPLALQDESKLQFTLQYASEAYHVLRNDSAYMATLKEGFRRFPEYPFFFPRIIDYYTGKQRLDSALAVADQALKVNADFPLFLLAKSVTLLNMERYDECIATSERLIAVNDTLPEPYFNIATAHLNKALELERKSQQREQREQIRSLYMAARPYMEAYRKLAPDDARRWAPALYRIYLNLNMGKQFEEIDRVMRSL